MAVIVGYLMVTGMKDSMLYYHTPSELLARVAADPSYHQLGVKVGGRVIPGTVAWDPRALDLRFGVTGLDEGGGGRFPVHYVGPLPDTFKEGREVVVEGVLSPDGVFEATTLLTKCGSRYQATEEELSR